VWAHATPVILEVGHLVVIVNFGTFCDTHTCHTNPFMSVIMTQSKWC
jgi:hypothetical protein